jgi:ACT domain-containing protein
LELISFKYITQKEKMDMSKTMKAVITVVGKDTVGIIAKVSNVCMEYKVNILDITQTVTGEYFAMIMLTDISALETPFIDFAEKLGSLGKENGLEIHVMHEDVFNTMHHI